MEIDAFIQGYGEIAQPFEWHRVNIKIANWNISTRTYAG
jgi:hypothetical protein